MNLWYHTCNIEYYIRNSNKEFSLEINIWSKYNNSTAFSVQTCKDNNINFQIRQIRSSKHEKIRYWMISFHV